MRQSLAGMQSASAPRTMQGVESDHSFQTDVTVQPDVTGKMSFDATRSDSVPGTWRSSARQEDWGESGGHVGGRDDAFTWEGIRDRRIAASAAAGVRSGDPNPVLFGGMRPEPASGGCSRWYSPISRPLREVQIHRTFPLKLHSRNSRYDHRGAGNPCATVSAAQISTVPVGICPADRPSSLFAALRNGMTG